MSSKTQKISILDVAASLGFSNKPFKIKKGPKAGQVDDKKIGLVRAIQGDFNARLAALRALTKIRPLGVKQGSTDGFVFFTRAMLDRKVAITTVL